ncbi:MAG: hypothetical protein AAGB32_01355 [Pseudomonadota bacterium]
MPKSDLHKQKKKKNFLFLALIFGFIALIWAITMIKVGNAG